MILMALALQAAAGQGGAKYLKCVLHDRSGETAFNVQLNEMANTVTYSFEMDGTVSTHTVRAAYSPERVSFNSFSISRTDLSFQRDNSDSPFLGVAKGMSAVDRGQCQLDTAKRVF